MVAFFGRGNNARGYQLTMGLLSVVSVVFFIVAFATTKERIQPDPQQKTSLTQDLVDLFSNRPWIVLFLVTTFYFTAISCAAVSCCPTSNTGGQREALQLVQRLRPRRPARRRYCLHGARQDASASATLFIASMCSDGALQPCRARPASARHHRHHRLGSPAPVLLRPPAAPLGDDGRRRRLRRVEDRPPRHRNCYRRGRLCLVDGARARRRHRRLAPFVYGYAANAVQTRAPSMGIRLTASLYAGTRFLRRRRLPPLLSAFAQDQQNHLRRSRRAPLNFGRLQRHQRRK